MILAIHLVVVLARREHQTAEVLRNGAAGFGAERIVVVNSTEAAVLEMGQHPVVVLFDVGAARLEGTRVELALRAANPRALLVAVGPTVPASVAFRLASHGVVAYLEEPFSVAEVSNCLSNLCRPLDPLVWAARSAVGVRNLKQAQRLVRLSMCEEALQRARGSRRAAARVLGVDRRAVQKIVTELTDKDTDDYAYGRALPSYGEGSPPYANPSTTRFAPQIVAREPEDAAPASLEPTTELRSRPRR